MDLYPLYYLIMLVLCGFSVSFLLSFRLTFVFHSTPAPSSFFVIIEVNLAGSPAAYFVCA